MVLRKAIVGLPDAVLPFVDDDDSAFPVGEEAVTATMLPDLPAAGAVVSLSGRSRPQIRGRVISGDRGRVFVELESDHVTFRRRARLAVDWVDPAGMVRRRGRLVSASPGGAPTVEIEFAEPPYLIQRREELRVPVKLKVSAWSFHSWTRLLEGETIDLSESGALLRLPKLPPATTRIELRLELPDRPLGLTARVLRRGDADTVAVAFDAVSAAGQERLREVLSPQLFWHGRTTVAA
jgi:hypothetical protein